MVNAFLKVRCADCSNEQIVFSRAASIVKCQVCGTTLAEPTAGSAQVKAEVVATLE